MRPAAVPLAACLTALCGTAEAQAPRPGPDGGSDAGSDARSDARADAPAPPPPVGPVQATELTVVGTRGKPPATAAHLIKSRELERLEHDDAHQILKRVPGVQARGEDGLGLRPNIGIRGVSPERSKKVTLMEDGVPFAPAPYAAPAAYYFPLVTRMESVRVIKGPEVIAFGPQTVGGAIDLVTRRIPTAPAGGADLAGGQYGYGKAHLHLGASSRTLGFLLEGVHLRSSGFKALDGGGDTGFARNELMGKLRWVPAPGARIHNELGLKLGWSSEASDETYLGLADDDFRATPLRRYRASRTDHMRWHRTQVALSHLLDFGAGRSVLTTAYRNDLDRTWRKVNRFGRGAPSLGEVLSNPRGERNRPYYELLTGARSTAPDPLLHDLQTLFIGPNQRTFVAQGIQSVGEVRWDGTVAHRLVASARLHHDSVSRLHTEDPHVFDSGDVVPDPAQGTVTNADALDGATAVALHLQDAVTWRRLTVTPGLRLELIATRSRDRLPGGTTLEGAPQRVLIPGLGALLALTDTSSALAGVYRGFSPAAPGQPAEVEPETSWNFEAGLRHVMTGARAELIGFFNDYRNLTSTCTMSSGCTGDRLDRQYNAGRARIWGAELFGQRDVRAPAGLTVPIAVSYTFTRTRLLDGFTSEDPSLGTVEPGFELPYLPRHQGSLSIGIEAARFGLSVDATYASRARETADDAPIDETAATDESLVLEAGARVYLWGHAQAYLLVRNLLGADDIASRRPFGARPIAPRWLQAGLKASF